MAHKHKDTLIAKMAAGFEMTVCDAIIAYCQRNRKRGEGDIYKEFIHPRRLNALAYESWCGDEATAYIDEKLARVTECGGRGITSEDPHEQIAAALELMNQHFIVTPEFGMTIYKVVDRRNRIVQPTFELKKSRQVAEAIKDDLNAIGVPCTPGLCEMIVGLFECNAVRQEPPKLWAQPGEDCWCLSRALVRPDPTVACPHLTATVNRLNDPDAFKTKIWGEYSGDYKGRQSLYISDKQGKSGKSSLLRAISRLFDLIETADGSFVPKGSERMGAHWIAGALNWNVLSNSTHASSHFAGKKLVWVGDNKNPSILMCQAVKELTGDDLSMLNPKHKPAYSAYLEASLIVLGNCEPNITSEVHATSRLLWLILAPLPVSEVIGDWDSHYDREMPGFLYECQQAWLRRSRDNGHEIEVNDAVRAALARRIEECEGKYSIPFAERFTLDEDAEIGAPAMNAILFGEWKWNEFKANDFHDWMERTYKIIPVKQGHRGIVYRGMREKTSYDRLKANADPQPPTPEMMTAFADDAEFC